MSLLAFYRVVDSGDMAGAVELCRDDVLFAAPPPGAGDTAPRYVTTDRAGLRERLDERGVKPYRHDLLVEVEVDGSHLVEGVIRSPDDGSDIATFAASAQLDDAGRIARYAAFMFEPPVPYVRADEPAPPVDAAEAVAEYFAAMEAGRFEDAAGSFSDDVVYAHPPYRPDGPRVVFTGRDELLQGFASRGTNSSTHPVVVIGQDGADCLLEGIHDNLPGGRRATFVSSLTFNPAGEITRYVAWACDPMVARR